jgi:hypothetical protein
MTIPAPADRLTFQVVEVRVVIGSSILLHQLGPQR